MGNRKFIMVMTLLMACVCAFMLWLVYQGARVENGFIIDRQGFVLGRDFLNAWHYGRAAFADNPAQFYDQPTYNAVLDSLFGGTDYINQQWSYPPHVILIMAPFAGLGYNAALAVFTALGCALYGLFVMRDFTHDNAAKAGGAITQAALLITPAAALCLIAGQFSLYLAVIFVTIFKTLDTRPVIAGLLIALLTIKPQIGFLFPVFLLATGRYRVFGWAVMGTVALIGTSVLWHGVEIWQTYFTQALGEQSTRMTESNPIVLGLMPTLMSNLAIVGIDGVVAVTAQALLAVGLIGAMIYVLRRQTDPLLQYSVFLVMSFAVTPYLMVYDTVVLVWVMLMVMARSEMSAARYATYGFVLVLPVLGVFLSVMGLSGFYAVILALAAWVLHAAWPQRERQISQTA